MSPEPMAQSEVVKRCCKVLDNFDKSLKLPILFWVENPPENAWVCVLKHCRVLVINVVDLLTSSLLLSQKNYKSWYCMPLTSTDDASDDSKKGKQLLDLCCRGRLLISMLASKNPIFC